MIVIRRIFLLLAILLAVATAVGWRASYRKSFEHWFRGIPIAGDVRVAGMTGTCYVAIRYVYADSYVPPPIPLSAAGGRQFWGISWQSVVGPDSGSGKTPRTSARRSGPPKASPISVGPPRWFRLEFVSMPFWIAQAITLTPVVLLLLPDLIRAMLRRRRRRGGCCIACGYDLTGNSSGVCPECGVAGVAEPGGQFSESSPEAAASEPDSANR